VSYSPGEVFRAVAEKRARKRLSVPDNIVSQRLIGPFDQVPRNYASRAMIAGATKFGDPLFADVLSSALFSQES
jgi:hypothetical protein